MIIKSFILENNIKSIIDKNIFLFYGENLGLKRDFKRKIKKELVNSETLNFVQEEIIKNLNKTDKSIEKCIGIKFMFFDMS